MSYAAESPLPSPSPVGFSQYHLAHALTNIPVDSLGSLGLFGDGGGILGHSSSNASSNNIINNKNNNNNNNNSSSSSSTSSSSTSNSSNSSNQSYLAAFPLPPPWIAVTVASAVATTSPTSQDNTGI